MWSRHDTSDREAGPPLKTRHPGQSLVSKLQGVSVATVAAQLVTDMVVSVDYE